MKRTISLKDYIQSQIYPLCVRLVFLVLLYSFFRLLFFLANTGSFPDVKLPFFFYGIRFDLSAIFYTNAPYILAAILPFSVYYKKIYRIVFNSWFVFINCFAAAVSYIDVAYYPYVLKRTTADIFSYLQVAFDVQTLLPVFMKQYWYLLLLFLATLFVIIYIVKITNRMITKNLVSKTFSWQDLGYKTLIFIVFLFLTVFFQRGGFQTRPLSLIDTGKNASIQNAPLIANTPFTLLKSFGKQQYEIKEFFQNLEEAEQYYSPIVKTITPCLQDCEPVKNVIFIVLESFSPYLIYDAEANTDRNEYQGYCPFLYSLLQQSVSFNGIANGRRTIEAMPAIFGGIPALWDMSYVESTFANNLTWSPVEVLKKYGYHTLFFHGAKNGSMNIGSYCYSIGFDAYYGKNEYPNPFNDDGAWGISDRSYLQYVAKTLNTVRQPFLAGVLTLSSHHPYVVPKDAEGLVLKQGPHPIHTVVSYTDYAVKEFFETLQHYSWYDSTLFIITADHTGAGAVPEPSNRYKEFQIPLFFYHPKANGSKSLGTMQQTDIMPTLFSYLNINKPVFSYGNSLLDSTYTSFAVNYLSGIYQLSTNDFILLFDSEKSIGFFDTQNDIMMQTNLINELPDYVFFYEQKLKALIQSYTTRMVQNQLFINKKTTPANKR